MSAQTFIKRLADQGADPGVIAKLALQVSVASAYRDPSLDEAAKDRFCKATAAEYGQHVGCSGAEASAALADAIEKAKRHREVAAQVQRLVIASVERATAAQRQLQRKTDPREEAEMADNEITKAKVAEIMTKRASEDRREGETTEQAYARYIRTPEGRTWYDAYKALPDDGSERPNRAVRKLAPAPVGAHAELVAKASALTEANPELTYQQAYARVSSEDRALFKRALVESYADGREAA